MDIIKKSLSDLQYRIPKPILEEAFRSDLANEYRVRVTSLEERILIKLLRPRVLVDCNLMGGVEAFVRLDGLTPIPTDQITLVYNIPKNRTQERTIVSVLSVGYVNFSMAFNSTGVGTVSPQSINDVLNVANAVFNSHSSAPPISTAIVTLIAENSIMIRDTNRIITNNYLRCVLANDDNLSHIPFRAIPSFCKLVELAVKSYIYNTMMIKMGSAYLSGGQELGVFKTIVEGYSDAEEMYQTFLNEKWSKIAFMSDNISYSRHIRSMIGSVK